MNERTDGSSASADRLTRFKGAAPFAAAGLAIVTALVGASVISSNGAAPVSTGEEVGVEATAPPPDPQGGGVPGVAFDQAPGAAPPAMGMEIVVKFRDDAVVKDIVDAFWRDQASAKSRFESFKSGKAEFAGLSLERVTYSNELVLVSTDGAAARLPEMRELAARLSSRADVAYAEPNMTAQPGAR